MFHRLRRARAWLKKNLHRWIRPRVALDLGTANTRLYLQGYGLVAEEPTLVDVHSAGDFVAPLRGGVICNVEAASQLISSFLERTRKLAFAKPSVLACVPSDATVEERAALIQATQQAGAKSVQIIPEPLAAAIGADVDISSPYAQMIVDIGDGVTDVAVIRNGQLVQTAAIRTACSDLHEAFRQYLWEQHQLVIDHPEAERIVNEASEKQVENLVLRDTRFAVTAGEVFKACEPVLEKIVTFVSDFVKELTPTTHCEIIENGIYLTGGGARIAGAAARLAQRTQIDVRIVKDPLHSVIEGAQKMLEFESLRGA